MRMERNWNSLSLLGKYRMMQLPWEIIWPFLIKVNITIARWLSSLTLHIYSSETKTRVYTKPCTQMFKVSLFIIAKYQKQLKCPSVGEQLNELWFIHTKEGNADTCNNLHKSPLWFVKWKKSDSKGCRFHVCDILDKAKNIGIGSSLVVQWVKNPVLSLLWLESLLWHGFHSWPGNFHMPWAWPKNIEIEISDCQRSGILGRDNI